MVVELGDATVQDIRGISHRGMWDESTASALPLCKTKKTIIGGNYIKEVTCRRCRRLIKDIGDDEFEMTEEKSSSSRASLRRQLSSPYSLPEIPDSRTDPGVEIREGSIALPNWTWPQLISISIAGILLWTIVILVMVYVVF